MQETRKKKKRILRRIKKRLYSDPVMRGMRRNKNMKRIIIAVIVLAALVVAFLILKSQEAWKRFDVSPYTFDESYEESDYEYNENILTILLIGVDSTGRMETSETFGGQARADNVDLICFNTLDKTVKILPISRDTITDVPKFSAQGYEVGLIKTHLGFAFTFGDGGNASSMNVCNAVSDLLYGTEVYRYVTTNIDSIGYANELIGGVTVRVPNDDLAGKYPEMTKGSMVELTDDNVADFLRYRDTNKDASNVGRMERQQAFLEAYVKKLETMTKSDYEEMWDKLSSDESKIQTNMSESAFLGLLAHIKEYKYDPVTDNLVIEGENKVEDGYDVFYPDEAKLKELVRTTFFKKMQEE